MCMIVSEETIRKATVMVNAPMKSQGCTNSPIYHVDRFHTYSNWTDNMDPNVAESIKRSVHEYTQRNSVMVGSRGSQGIQYGRCQTSSTTRCSKSATRRAQLYRSWNKEVLSSLDQALLMCEMVDLSIPRSARVACAEAIKTKIDR